MSQHRHTKTSTQGWGSRIGGSIKGIFFGIILFLISFVVLWWNEGRAVKTAEGLTEGAGIVTSVFSGDVDPKHEGDLIHIVDEVISTDTITDPTFNIQSTELKLQRKVEMYQWVESKSEKKEKNLGGSETTTTTYDYNKEWSETMVNSNNFEVSGEYNNPNHFPYEKEEFEANQVTMGAFDFPSNLMGNLNNYKSISLNNYDSPIKNSKVTSNSIYIGDGTEQNPRIGDMKISFYEVNEALVSVISQQSGNTLRPYKTENESTISLLEMGDVAPESMFEAAQSRNSTMTWILRFVGFLLMFFGISKVFKPLVVLGDVVPFIGRIIGGGVSIVAGLISITLTLTTIAIAWIFYRPILAFSLLGIAAGALIFIFIKNKKEKSAL